MDKTINGTALEAPCWGIDVRGRKSCLSYDEALAADAAFPPADVGTVAFVVGLVRRRLRLGGGPDGAEPGRPEGLDLCTNQLVSWVEFPGRRDDGFRHAIDTQVWKRLTLYQKCAIYNATRRGPRGAVHARPIGHTQAPGAELRRDRSRYDAHVDRRAPRHPEPLARGGELERGQSAPGA